MKTAIGQPRTDTSMDQLFCIVCGQDVSNFGDIKQVKESGPGKKINKTKNMWGEGVKKKEIPMKKITPRFYTLELEVK